MFMCYREVTEKALLFLETCFDDCCSTTKKKTIETKMISRGKKQIPGSTLQMFFPM